VRKRLLPALLCAGILVFACSDEEQENCCLVDPGSPGFENLTERWHVLNNLEAAYNQRNSTEYDRIIDPDDFTFMFTVSSSSQSWGPVADKRATAALLQDAINIDLDIVLPDTLLWTPISPDSFPDETWYQVTVIYMFVMRFNRDPETTFLTANQPLTSLIVRPYDDNGTERWRLVEWTDLANTLTIIPRASGSVEETTWGGVKALFWTAQPAVNAR